MSDEEKLSLVPSTLPNIDQLHNMMGRDLENCGNCSAFRDDPMRKGGGVGLCCARPPVVQLIQGMTGSPLNPGGMQPQIQLQGFWPPTEKRRWCREWEPINGRSENQRTGS